MMSMRWQHLQYAYEGLKKTGISLIEWDGKQFLPSLTADDIGIYIIIPKIALFFNIPLEATTQIFFSCLVYIPAFISLCILWLLYQSYLQRCISLITMILLTKTAINYPDVYMAYFAACILMPWVIYFFYHKQNNTLNFLASLTIGLYAGILHYIRSYAGLPLLVFLWVFQFHIRSTKKYGFFIATIIGLSIPIYLFKQQCKYYKEFMQTQPHTKYSQEQHVFWHTMYAGFGFLQPNPEHILYQDDHTLNQARIKSKNNQLTFFDQKYEIILKKMTLDFIKQYKEFLLILFFAKLGVLLYVFLKYANIGILCFFYIKKPCIIDLAFLLAIITSCIFPIIAIPILREYTLGFITISSLWSSINIMYFVKNMYIKTIFNYLYTRSILLIRRKSYARRI